MHETQENSREESVDEHMERVFNYIARRKAEGANLISITNELKSPDWDQNAVEKVLQSINATAHKNSDMAGTVGYRRAVGLAGYSNVKVPTRLGSLIILLAAVIAGSVVWWYTVSYEVPEGANNMWIGVHSRDMKDNVTDATSTLDVTASSTAQ